MSQHKYGAKATTVDGIRFASQKEARRYQELRLLERAGEVFHLLLQPEYQLETVAVGSGVRRTLGVYRADFAYTTRSGDVIEDVKGFKTPLYKWKKKHVEAQYGITILET